MADFFEKGQPQPEVAPEEPSKVKVGESEYSQEELTKLVGLGQIAQEAETKYGRSVEKFWPEYTKSQQELKDLRGKVEEFEKFQTRLKGEETQPSQEDLKKQALEQARSLGIVTKDELEAEARRIAREERQAEKVFDEINAINKEAEELGKPKIDVKEFLEYAEENGLGNASVKTIYKIKFDNELEDWKQKQLDKVKQTDFTTQTASTAGAKTPPTEREPFTKSNFSERLRSYINSRNGQE